MILFECFKSFYDNGQKPNTPDEVLLRNEEYLKSIDDLFCWVDNTFEKTDNSKDVVKMKEVYMMFKISDVYINSSKKEKRENTYKKFIETFQKSKYLKKYVA